MRSNKRMYGESQEVGVSYGVEKEHFIVSQGWKDKKDLDKQMERRRDCQLGGQSEKRHRDCNTLSVYCGPPAGTTVEYHEAPSEGAYLLLKIQRVIPWSSLVLICSIPKLLPSKFLHRIQSVFCNIRSSCSWNKKHSCSLSPIKYCFINLKTVINYISAFWLQANIHNSFSLSSQSASNLLIIFSCPLAIISRRKKAFK